MVGIGYDIHHLVENRPLYLGGVRINFPKGLLGHSDGDVLLHAICDALLGAANLGDIGMHFPANDDRYKNIASTELLKSVNKYLKDSGFFTTNLDAIVIAEQPKIVAYKTQMKKNISVILGIPTDVISIKGKTNEGLDSIGRGEAIAAWAICEIARIYDTPEG
jgi:2-C-methyl-D-erythritol 2,4-cyclodiphosphate synthase